MLIGIALQGQPPKGGFFLGEEKRVVSTALKDGHARRARGVTVSGAPLTEIFVGEVAPVSERRKIASK